MNKCSAVEMRKNLILVEELKIIGLDFVPIPVIDDDHKKKLLNELDRILLKLTDDAELRVKNNDR